MLIPKIIKMYDFFLEIFCMYMQLQMLLLTCVDMF